MNQIRLSMSDGGCDDRPHGVADEDGLVDFVRINKTMKI